MDCRVFKRGLVIHSVFIEQDYVCVVALCNYTTPVYLESFCWVLRDTLNYLL